MSQYPVEDLLQQQASAKMAQTPTTQLAKTKTESTDIREWAVRAPVPWSLMFAGGIGLATLGAILGILASIFTAGIFELIVATGFLTMGGGLAFLGGYKRNQLAQQKMAPALPAGDAKVIEERSRRIADILAKSDHPYTFERLFAKLQWTKSALLSTLIYMKEKDLVIEDLDFDTGEWVYTVLQGAKRPEKISQTQSNRVINTQQKAESSHEG